MFTKRFWVDTCERAITTGAESVLAAVGVDVVSAVTLNWEHVGGIALTAAFLSVLKSLYARRHGNPEKASLVQ